MSDLKSEIEQYLFNNGFVLSNDKHSSKLFSYNHNVVKAHCVTLLCEPNKHYIFVDLGNNIDDKKNCYAERFIINTIEDFIFLITHSTRSILCDENLLI